MDEFYEDKTITCRDCQQPFVFTGGEQKFFANQRTAEGQPFTAPVRCKPCREAKKAARENRGGGAGPVQGRGYSPPSDANAPRRPFVYDPASDPTAARPPEGNQGTGKKRSGGGKKRRDDESGWGGGGFGD